MGALHGANDARRRVWTDSGSDGGEGQGIFEIADRAATGCATAKCAVRRRHRDAYGEDDIRAGRGVLPEGGIPDESYSGLGNEARNERSDVPCVYAGETGDPEAARG